MSEKLLTISQLYAKGRETLSKRGVTRWFPPDSNMGAAAEANRKYLDSLFYETKFLDPVDVDTSLTIFGVELKTPAFCSPISQLDWMEKTDIFDIAQGIKNAGSLLMLGIGGSKELQDAIDTGVPVVKMVKPYRRTELIYEKVRDAESHGCVAVGMDIDHFHGLLVGDEIQRTELFAPQQTSELRQVFSQTKLPFIIKGVLSISDAQKAVDLGASAVVVSNHGPGSFSFSVPSMIALPRITDSVGKQVTVLIDSGFKTGNDVFKALAFGAKGVGFASSILLALAAQGSEGVELLINQITAELQRTMAGTGCPNLSAINREIIVHYPT